jgi:hypothetical protein
MKKSPIPKKSKVSVNDAIPVEPKTGFFSMWAGLKEIFCEDLGLTVNEFENLWIDYRERMFMRRFLRIKRSKLFGIPKGPYIEFYTASSLSHNRICMIGPFDTIEDSADCYDMLIDTFGFNKGLKINQAEQLDSLFDLDDDEGLFDLDDDLFDMDDDDEGLLDIDDDESLFDMEDDDDMGLFD